MELNLVQLITYPPNSVDAEIASAFQDMVEQGEYIQKVQKERVPPHRSESHGTTCELFTQIKQAIAEQTQLSGNATALLTFWIFTT